MSAPPSKVRAYGLALGPLVALGVFWLMPDTYAGPDGGTVELGAKARVTAGLAVWMALWWMTEAIPEGDRARTTIVTQIGSPFFEIVRYAQDQQIDLVVLGTHGRGPLGHMLLGSVAEKVVRKAPCPVLTVRHPQRTHVAAA